MKNNSSLILARLACAGFLLSVTGAALADHHHGASASDLDTPVGDATTTVDGTAADDSSPTLTVDGTASAGEPVLTVDGTARGVHNTDLDIQVVPASTETVDGTADRTMLTTPVSAAQPIETVDGTALAGNDCWRVETVDGTAAIVDAPQSADCASDTTAAE